MKLFRGLGQSVLPAGQIDPQLLIVVITCILSAASFFFVRSQVDAEWQRLVQTGFIEHFDGTIWMKVTGGEVSIVQTGDEPARAFMAPSGLMLAGFMTFACLQDAVSRSHSRWSFVGALGLMGLILGLGSLFQPSPNGVTVDVPHNRICIVSGAEKCAPAWPDAQLSIVPFRENISTDGYAVEVVLRDGAARVALTLQHQAQAQGVLDMLHEHIDLARKARSGMDEARRTGFSLCCGVASLHPALSHRGKSRGRR